MSEETMPATEAAERHSYELAFHVLPTVAEGEVSGVFEAIKSLITTHGGELLSEEAPERFELAYEVIKHIDTKNRKFSSAYFGWVRFSSEATAIDEIKEGVEENPNILRYLLIKLTKAEEENPFYFHEALAEQKVVTIDAEEQVMNDEVAETTTEEEDVKEAATEEVVGEDAEVQEEKTA